MKIISCPEQEFSTLCKPGYPWKFSERDGVTIYTEHENSIPYVLVYRSEDWIMDAENLIREQYTPYMQKKYGDDLVAVTEFDEYTLGGRPVSAALYTYKLQGYLIDMIRAYENVNGHTVSYTAKYIQGQGEATLAALDAAVQNYRPFADYYSSESNHWRYSIIPTEDGGTIFLFNEVFITIPADWAGKYDIKINERSISFYQSLSRSLWNSREGFEGGLLFSLGYSETEDFRNLPSYDELGKGDGWLIRKLGQLYFRIANWRQPSVIESDGYQDYLLAGCRRATFAESCELIRLPLEGDYCSRLNYIYNKVEPQTVLIVEGINRDRHFWQEITDDERTGVTFDLYYCGIVMFDKKRQKQNYIINF